jgi:glyoxylase-like metal-dependent hydrolase (beta-lactamase superfamily II)
MALAAALTAASAAPMLAQNFDTVQVRPVAVAPGLYMLMGAGGNIGVSAGPDGVFLVDDQYAPLTEKIVAAIRSFSDRPIRFVLNTHWHGDHTGGNENMGKAGVLLVAHDNVRRRMSVDQFQEAFNRTVPAAPKAALPVVTFNETVTFWLNDDEIHAFHVAPAHTDGDAIIHFQRSNTVHMGDTYFNGLWPFIDIASGGSVDGMIAAADAVLKLVRNDTRIIPGHGPLSNPAELRAFRDMLTGVRDGVRAEIAQGRTVEQVLASNVTAQWDSKMTGTKDRFLRYLYLELAQKARNR